MISGELIQLLCHFRRTESEQNFISASPFSIDDALYNTFLQALLESAQTLNLQNTTKFMAKKYLDFFLSVNSVANEEKLLLVVLTCLRVAIKFNQASNLSFTFTIPYCSQLTQGKHSQQNFIDFQIELIKILGFRFRLTTPYDFIIIKNLLPQEKKVMRLLESVIDFTVTLIEVRNITAEEIFFGALLYCCQKKNSNQICYQIIKATTLKWDEAQKVSVLVDQKLSQLLQQ